MKFIKKFHSIPGRWNRIVCMVLFLAMVNLVSCESRYAQTRVYNKGQDKPKRSAGHYILVGVGVVAAVFVVVAAIAIATKSSCPFVYTKNGDSYTFQGEMYGGAIYSSLERDDYMPLPSFTAKNNLYELRITNELLERQYTDLAQLIIVNHSKNAKVLIDKNGIVHSYSAPETGFQVVSDQNIDHAKELSAQDQNSFLFNDDNPGNKDLSSIILSFKKTNDAIKANLIVTAKNSFWLDYTYGEFTKQFGTYYNKYAENQRNVPAAKNIQWALDQGIPLSVYVQTEKGWELVDYFNVVGPLAPRDMIMPLDLEKVKGNIVNVKLECGFMFWEVDYAALDFSEEIPVSVINVPPSSAIDQNGKDVCSVLSTTDGQYLVQPEIGDEVTIKYKATSPGKETSNTCFLHSRGYYEYIRDFKNKPDFLNLISFKQKGSFTRYAKHKYYDMLTRKDFIASALNN